MITPKVGIKKFQRMAARNLSLRGINLDDIEDERAKVDAVAEAYEDETTRIPVNRAARRAFAKVVKRASSAS